MAIVHGTFPESGVVSVDRELCSGCGECVEACPADHLALDRSGEVSALPDSHFGCIACAHCMMVCPTGAIQVRGRGLEPGHLVPLPFSESRADFESLEALMLSRRSVRRFEKRAVPADVLARVVRAAETAPMGIPPWDLGCVTIAGHDAVQALAQDVVRGYEGFLKIFRPSTLALMRPLLGREKHAQFKTFIRPLARAIVENAREGRDKLFWDAPALLFFHVSPYADPADAAIACTYAMLAAESLGLGSTMIGSAAPILQRDPAPLERLGMPKGHRPAISLILGYPDREFLRGVQRSFVGPASTRAGTP